MILVTPNCFLCDCTVRTEEEKGEDGKRLEGHGVLGRYWCPWQLHRSHQWQPGPWAGQTPSGSHLAGESQSSRRGRQEKNSGVWKKHKEEEFAHPRPVSFCRDEQLVRNRHPVCCLKHQKHIRVPKPQPDGSRGRWDTALWIRECCLSCRPLVHLVAKPAQPC